MFLILLHFLKYIFNACNTFTDDVPVEKGGQAVEQERI